MNITYTRYAARTGRVIDVISLPDRVDDFDHHATLLYEGEIDGESFYFDNGAVTPRPTQATVSDKTEISVVSQEILTISQIPDPCTITVSGPTGTSVFGVSGGSLEFTAALAGEYQLLIESFPFIPVTINVRAV